jgi:hypothetical protein
MSSLANVILFLALVTTSIMVGVMYVKLRRLDRYHAEYQQIFERTGEALKNAQAAVVSFGAEGKETLAMLGMRIDEAKAVAEQLETLTQKASQHTQLHSNSRNR